MLRRFTPIAVAAALFLGLASAPAFAEGPVTRTLARKLPELKLTGVSLADAIDFMRDVSGANIHVNWRALETVSVTRDTQVNLNMRNVSLRKALNMLLSEAGGGEAQIAWTVDEGVIEITTAEIANANMVVRIYSIEDLLLVVPDFDNAPDFNLQQSATRGGGSGSGGGGGGGGGQGLFNQGGGEREEEVVKTKDERAEELVTLIKDIVFPDVWVDNGGTASIRYYNGNLIVRAPRNVHEAIGGTRD